MATAQATIVENAYVSIGYLPDEGQAPDLVKVIMKFDLPDEVMGVTPSAAVLNIYENYAEPNDLIGVTAHTCTDVAWEQSDSVAILDALTLSGILSTQNLAGVGWKSFDVLGDWSEGLMEACESSRSQITVILKRDVLQPITLKIPSLSLGQSIIGASPGRGDLKGFAEFGADVPYIEITYEGTGILAMSAGVVV